MRRFSFKRMNYHCMFKLLRKFQKLCLIHNKNTLLSKTCTHTHKPLQVHIFQTELSPDTQVTSPDGCVFCSAAGAAPTPPSERAQDPREHMGGAGRLGSVQAWAITIEAGSCSSLHSVYSNHIQSERWYQRDKSFSTVKKERENPGSVCQALKNDAVN